MKLKKIKIGIDSPVAAGAGTISKMLAMHYNLLYCDTGKIYRYLAKKLIQNKPKNKILYLKKISKKINLVKLKNKSLLNDDVALIASQIAKDLKVRKLVVKFQKNLAYNPPEKYKGSVLDGRDINSKIIKDADFKFYITALFNSCLMLLLPQYAKVQHDVQWPGAQRRLFYVCKYV